MAAQIRARDFVGASADTLVNATVLPRYRHLKRLTTQSAFGLVGKQTSQAKRGGVSLLL